LGNAAAGTAPTFGGLRSQGLVSEGTRAQWREASLAAKVALRNPDFKLISLNTAHLKLLQRMEIEEAIIVGLLAVGMSLLAVLTMMIFW